MLTAGEADSQVNTIARNWNMELSSQISDDLNGDDLKVAAELFLYLSFCPGKWKPWFVFYKDLLQTKSPYQVILTLNRIMKVPWTPQNKHLKSLAKTLVKKMKSHLNLNLEKIQNYLPGKKRNLSLALALEDELMVSSKGYVNKIYKNIFTCIHLHSVFCT